MESCDAALARARHSVEQRSFVAAIGAYEAAVVACNRTASVLISLAQVQYLAGRPADAEATLLKLDVPEAHYALGRMFYEQGRYPEAVDRLERVVRSEPQNFKAHDNLGLCYDILQEDTKALHHFFRALDLVKSAHQDYDWAHANLADFFLKRNEAGKAFQLAAEAAQRNPSAARNFYLTGRALVMLKRDENSIRWFREAVRLDGTHAEARFQLGQALKRLGRETEATEQLRIFRQLKVRER